MSLTEEQEAHVRKVRLLASQLMVAHGLAEDWYFSFNSNRRRIGICRYHTGLKTGRIELSIHFVVLNDLPTVRDVLLHEIAHGLTPGHGHDRVFKRKCLEIGGDPAA